MFRSFDPESTRGFRSLRQYWTANRELWVRNPCSGTRNGLQCSNARPVVLCEKAESGLARIGYTYTALPLLLKKRTVGNNQYFVRL